MGNQTGLIDVVYPMDVPQRLNHLVHGYFRINYNKQKNKYFTCDISIICIKYLGITEYNQYHLIKSNTELKIEKEQRDKRKLRGNRLKIDNKLKIVLLGSKGVGKTALELRFRFDIFVEGYDPTFNDYCVKRTLVDDTLVLWDIIDAIGSEEFSSMRELWIREGQAFLFVYSITSQSSFEEIQVFLKNTKRIKEGEEWFGVIVGNKVDLEDMRRVSAEEGRMVVKGHDNLKFMETSAKQKINHEEPFHECARWFMYSESKSDKGCCSVL